MTRRADFEKLILLARANTWLDQESIALVAVDDRVGSTPGGCPGRPACGVTVPVRGRGRVRRVVPWRPDTEEGDPARLLQEPNVVQRSRWPVGSVDAGLCGPDGGWSDQDDADLLDWQRVELVAGATVGDVSSSRTGSAGEEIRVRLTLPVRVPGPTPARLVAAPMVESGSVPVAARSAVAWSEAEADWLALNGAAESAAVSASPVVSVPDVVPEVVPVAPVVPEVSPVPVTAPVGTAAPLSPAGLAVRLPGLLAGLPPCPVEERSERVIVPVEKLFSGLSHALGDAVELVVGRRPAKRGR
ncbi:MAG: hypothetical protein H7838_05495 [Magnetococcus sp. DMHC-8]